MILRCYLNVSAILRRHTKSCFLCFFPLYFSFLIHRNFYLLVYDIYSEEMEAEVLGEKKRGDFEI